MVERWKMELLHLVREHNELMEELISAVKSLTEAVEDLSQSLCIKKEERK